MPPVYPLSYLLCFITPTSSLYQLPVGETAYRLSFIHCQHLFLYFFTFFTLFSNLLFLATLFCSLFYTPILIYILCPVIKPNLYCILLHILHSLTLFVNFYLASSKYLSIINVVYINFLQEAKIPIETNRAPVRDGDGPRINDAIKAKQVRLIDAEGENRGIVTISEALQIADEAGLDLIEISPQANPPVCKVLDYGKYKYEVQKRKNEAKKNQKVVNIKELKIRPAIDTHDYDVKIKQAKKFLSQGDKVKFTMRFKGRELSANDMGSEILNKIIDDLDIVGKVDSAPKLEGRQMSMIISPEK